MPTFAELSDLLAQYWPYLVFTFSLLVGGTAAIHAAMTKHDVRAAIGWAGVCLMSPLLGPTLYVIAGINRIRRESLTEQHDEVQCAYPGARRDAGRDIPQLAGPQFVSLKTLGDRVSTFPLQGGNAVQLLCGGDEAYPAMIAAIDAAHHSVVMQSYIFDNDTAGRTLADALIRAHARGVAVRILIDAVGARYSRPPIRQQLRRAGIDVAHFLTNPMGLRMPYANLRSHRKILVVDGTTGFTGGMNIRAAFMRHADGTLAGRDAHFLLRGPIVAQIHAVFANDWRFTTGEALPPLTEPDPLPDAHVLARCVASGPDRLIARTHQMLLGALSIAQHNVRIQSPYFLPDQVLLGALNTAARRGVQVDIVIPHRNNLRLVNYAMIAQLDQVLRSGCRVWRAYGPFNHAKLLTIDGAWSYVGSSNLDPRSLRLNFELDLEIYDRELAAQLSTRIDADIAQAEAVTPATLAALPFRKQLRNRIIWLASPYL